MLIPSNTTKIVWYFESFSLRNQHHTHKINVKKKNAGTTGAVIGASPPHMKSLTMLLCDIETI